MLGFALLVAQVLSSEASFFDPTVYSSARPALCSAGAAPGLWDRARFPELSAYCRELARGYSRLGQDPAAARGAAARARRLRPSAAAPHVLLARALYALGRNRESFETFERALSIDRTSLRSVDALYDYARSALVTRRLERAVPAYRALVPRAVLASKPNVLRVEAASLLLAQGPIELTEALFVIGVARQQNLEPDLDPYVIGLWALALSRAGRSSEGQAAKREMESAWLAFEEADRDERPSEAPPGASFRPLLLDVERHAMIAVLAEAEAPDVAAEHYAAYLADPSRPAEWRAHAERRLAALGMKR